MLQSLSGYKTLLSMVLDCTVAIESGWCKREPPGIRDRFILAPVESGLEDCECRVARQNNTAIRIPLSALRTVQSGADVAGFARQRPKLDGSRAALTTYIRTYA